MHAFRDLQGKNIQLYTVPGREFFWVKNDLRCRVEISTLYPMQVENRDLKYHAKD